MMEDRHSWEFHVCRIPEDAAKDTITIAARKTLFESLEILYAKNCQERPNANTKMLICKATARFPIGHIGKVIVVFGIHGNRETMKIIRQTEYSMIWDRVKDLIQEFDVNLFAGDYNMAMMQVPTELRYRGIPPLANGSRSSRHEFRPAIGHGFHVYVLDRRGH